MSTSLSLYDIEEGLTALLDTEDMVSPEQRIEFRQELAEQFRLAVDKRESCGRFLRACEAHAQACTDEIERLKNRRDRIEAAAERMRGIIQHVIEAQGTDEKGRYRKLEGHTFTFSLRRTPPSVIIHNVDLIPPRFSVVKTEISVSKSAIKRAIEAGEQVPGADLTLGGLTLQVK